MARWPLLAVVFSVSFGLTTPRRAVAVQADEGELPFDPANLPITLTPTQGSFGTMVTITGSNFRQASRVTFISERGQDVPISTNYVSQSELSFEIPRLAHCGTHTVRVVTPRPGGAGQLFVTQAASFSVIRPCTPNFPGTPHAKTTWGVNLDWLRVRDHQENGGDEPYLIVVGFRATVGESGSTETFVNDFDRELAEGAKAGPATINIPASVGSQLYRDVEILGQGAISGAKRPELIGMVIVAMESDGTPWSAIRDIVTQLEDAVRAELRDVIEPATDGELPLLGANLVEAAERIEDAASGGNFWTWLSSWGDPDDRISHHVLIFPAVDDEVWNSLAAIAPDDPAIRFGRLEDTSFVVDLSGNSASYDVLVDVSEHIVSSGRLSFTRIGTHPSERELSGEQADSEQAQGIAFDEDRWFYSNQKSLFRLSRDFRDSDRSFRASKHEFGGIRCEHAGGVDFYGGELYVALDDCADQLVRVAAFDADLSVKRSATIPELEGSFPYVAVNPLDDGFFYVESPDSKKLLAFSRDFEDGASLVSVKHLRFQENPDQVLHHYWKQGGAFTGNGLFLRTVDDAKDEDSDHTGVWVYETGTPVVNGAMAWRVGFINIRYDPDQWFLVPCGPTGGQCLRDDELEDIDASSVSGGPTAGDVHILMLSNEADEDDVTVLHYRSGDFDGDGVRDTLDNCVWRSNSGQEDADGDGLGTACDALEELRRWPGTDLRREHRRGGASS